MSLIKKPLKAQLRKQGSLKNKAQLREKMKAYKEKQKNQAQKTH